MPVQRYSMVLLTSHLRRSVIKIRYFPVNWCLDSVFRAPFRLIRLMNMVTRCPESPQSLVTLAESGDTPRREDTERGAAGHDPASNNSGLWRLIWGEAV